MNEERRQREESMVDSRLEPWLTRGRGALAYLILGALVLLVPNLASVQAADPTPTPTPTATPTPCPDSAFDQDKDGDGAVACGEDFCDRDPQKQEPGKCGCQYQGEGGSSCSDPGGASPGFCDFVATATKTKVVRGNSVRTMRLGWRVTPSFQGRIEYRCQVFERSLQGGKVVVRPVKIDKNSLLKREVVNPVLSPFPPGDNSTTLIPTPVPALFEIRRKEVSGTNQCDTKPLALLINSSSARKTCRCVKSVPQAGLWCHDLKATEKFKSEYFLQCRIRGKQPGLENVITSSGNSGPVFIGMSKTPCS